MAGGRGKSTVEIGQSRKSCDKLGRGRRTFVTSPATQVVAWQVGFLQGVLPPNLPRSNRPIPTPPTLPPCQVNPVRAASGQPPLALAKRSAYLYVEGTFYNDMRAPGAADYSEPIRRFNRCRGGAAGAARRRQQRGLGGCDFCVGGEQGARPPETAHRPAGGPAVPHLQQVQQGGGVVEAAGRTAMGS